MIPAVFHIEITTCCNLSCPMCIKHAPGCSIDDREMTEQVFTSVLPHLKQADTVILNGIGEPLTHPGLERFIELARGQMPPHSTLGFQSNGLLLEEKRVSHLLSLGLDTICISVDSLHQGEHGLLTVDALQKRLEEAIAILQRGRQALRPNFRIGIETVIGRENLDELPDIVQWAGKNRIDYLIVSHLLPYSGTAAANSLLNPHPEAATTLYEELCRQTEPLGDSLDSLHSPFTRFHRNARTRQLINLLEETRAKATSLGLRLHFPELARYRNWPGKAIETIFHRARRLGEKYSIELRLPPLQPPIARGCRFMEKPSVFIDVTGQVTACHFLWHGCQYMMGGEKICILPRFFGRLPEQPLDTIWKDEAFVQFRKEATAAQYPPCWNCPQGPCPDLLGETTYGNDCTGSSVPCGHCPWSLGLFACL